MRKRIMRKNREEALASAVYDGERSAEGLSDPERRFEAQLGWFRRLSEALRVPADFAEEDAGFVVRFRVRRDAVSEVLAPGRGWRWLALRLVPLAACAVLTAGLVLWSANDRPSAFSELEMREIGDGLADITTEVLTEEPVLRIALGDLEDR